MKATSRRGTITLTVRMYEDEAEILKALLDKATTWNECNVRDALQQALAYGRSE